MYVTNYKCLRAYLLRGTNERRRKGRRISGKNLRLLVVWQEGKEDKMDFLAVRMQERKKKEVKKHI